MWLFSKENVSSFSYTKSGEEYTYDNGWSLFECIGKKGEELSMFIHQVNGKDNIAVLQNAVKRNKTLKHPDIINYVDSSETAKEIIIVTERVMSLSEYLKRRVDGSGGNLNFITSWGLLQIVRALLFLEERCNLRHGRVCLESILVTKSGDWRLGLLDNVSPLTDDFVYGEPRDGTKVDSYGVGRLMWEVYNRKRRHGENEDTLFREAGNVPAQLMKVFKRLVQSKGTTRLDLSSVMRQLTASGGFCDNFYVETLQFVEHIHVKEEKERRDFLERLPNLLDSVPVDAARYKVLPLLLQLSSTGGEEWASLWLPVVVRLGRLLPENVPETAAAADAVLAQFKSPSRRTRVLLLRLSEDLSPPLLTKAQLEGQVMPALLSALTDTHPAVREAAVRAAPALANHIRLVPEPLLRALISLLARDLQAGLRANTAVSLAKLAHLLESTTALPAALAGLLRATRDSFSPARLAAVSALAAVAPLCSNSLLAGKALPCLCFLTIDSESSVRAAVFPAIRAALTRLEQESANQKMSIPEAAQALVSSSTVSMVRDAVSKIGWSDWASSLSARLTSSKVVPVAASTAPETSSVPVVEMPPSQAQQNKETDNPIKDENGWGDWDDGEDDFFSNLSSKPTSAASNRPGPLVLGGTRRRSDDDDGLDGFSLPNKTLSSAKPIQRAASNFTAPVNQNELDKCRINNISNKAPNSGGVRKQQVKSSKKEIEEDDVDNGWGDSDW